LKYLHIVDCSEFKSIEIFAPNLEYFGYVGPRIKLHINYAPRLQNVRIGGMAGLPVTYAFVPLSSYLYQLQSLTLNIVMFFDVRTLNSLCTYVYSVLCTILSSLVCFSSGKRGIPKISNVKQS
jgi:hypothetical protein